MFYALYAISFILYKLLCMYMNVELTWKLDTVNNEKLLQLKMIYLTYIAQHTESSFLHFFNVEMALKTGSMRI